MSWRVKICKKCGANTRVNTLNDSTFFYRNTIGLWSTFDNQCYTSKYVHMISVCCLCLFATNSNAVPQTYDWCLRENPFSTTNTGSHVNSVVLLSLTIQTDLHWFQRCEMYFWWFAEPKFNHSVIVALLKIKTM